MIPVHDQLIRIKVCPVLVREMLDYCAYTALQENEPESLSYINSEDIVVYHYKVKDFDRDLFIGLKDVDEIWIAQRAIGGTS